MIHETQITLCKRQALKFLENSTIKGKPLVVFDLDGTLIDGEPLVEIAKSRGVHKEVEHFTRLAMNKEIDFEVAVRQRIKLLRGTPAAQIHKIIDSIPITKGAEELILMLRKKGFRTGIITGGFDFWASKIAKKLGMDFYWANFLHFKGGELSGELDLHVDDKGELIRELISSYDIPFSVAIGDGGNDITMLKSATLGIAFCPKDALRKEAQHIIESKNLFCAYEIILNNI